MAARRMPQDWREGLPGRLTLPGNHKAAPGSGVSGPTWVG